MNKEKKVNEKLIIEKYEEGLSCKKIQDLIGISQATIRRRLIKNNIKIRVAGFQKGNKPICPFKKGHTTWNYKGGSIGKNGYKIIWKDGKRIYEHQLIWNTQSDWHFIPDGFVIHHINSDKLDNRIENLTCLPNDYHKMLHDEIRRGVI